VLEINVVMIIISLHFCNPHKHGGRGCKRIRNNMQKMKRGERMCRRRMSEGA
jgi:hypothetical protein